MRRGHDIWAAEQYSARAELAAPVGGRLAKGQLGSGHAFGAPARHVSRLLACLIGLCLSSPCAIGLAQPRAASDTSSDGVRIVAGSAQLREGGPEAAQVEAWIAQGTPGLESMAGPKAGLATGNFWFRFQVRNATPTRVKRTVEMGNTHHLEQVWVFQVSGDRIVARWRLGQGVPHSQHSSAPGDIAFPLSVASGSTDTLLMRFTIHGLGLQMEPVLWDESAYVKRFQRKMSILWLFEGLMAVMAVYHLLVYLRLRDRTYLFFVGVVALGLCLDVAVMDGLQMLMQSESPLPLSRYFGLVGLGLSTTWCFFSAEALETRSRNPRTDRMLRWLAWLQVVTLIALSPLSPRSWMQPFFALNGLSMLACIAAGVVSLRTGYKPARLYLASWVTYFLFILLQITAGQSRELNFGALGEHFGRSGVAVQILVFALVLAERYALINRRTEETQADLIESQKLRMVAQIEALRVKEEAAATLQQKVDERTAQLAHEKRQTENKHRDALQAQAQAEQAHLTAEQARAESDRQKDVAEEQREAAESAHTKIAEMDRQKTQFFQNISHELRTPLTLILSPLIEEARDQPENGNLSVALRNARRLLRLVNQLLEFQKLEAGKRAVRLSSLDLVDFIQTATACFEPSCHRRRVTLRFTVESEEVEGEAPRRFALAEIDALEKILFNYLSNALKFAPKGGNIQVDLSREGEQLRLSVRDDGEGIAPEDQGQLFQVFTQVDGSASREHEGTGLGLALVKQLTTAMNGQVGVESAPGAGACFWIDLPEQHEPAGGYLESHPTHPESFAVKPWLLTDGEEQHVSLLPAGLVTADNDAQEKSATVLVVDDLVDMRELIAHTLQREGYQIQLADRGDRALEMARRNPPDLIVTDWMMPGMTGPDLVRELREERRLQHIPVVLLTAKSDAESKANATQAGADAFLGKPFDASELNATVRNLLALKSREKQVEQLNLELQASVSELRALFDSMRQAVFSFGRDRKVRGYWSAAAARIFEIGDLTDLPVDALLLDPLPEWYLERSTLKTWLDLIFEAPADEFEQLTALAPPELLLRGDTHDPLHVQLEFRPVLEDGSLSQVMCLATDVTQQRRAEEREAESQAEVQFLRGLTDGGAGLVGFLRTSEHRLAQFEDLLPAQGGLEPARVTELFRLAHTIKGDARLHMVESIEQATASIEQALQPLRDGESSPEDPGRPVRELRSLHTQALGTLHATRERLVSVSPVGEAIFDQTMVSRGILEQVREASHDENATLRGLVQQLTARPFGESARRLQDSAASWAAEHGKELTVEVGSPEVLVPGDLAQNLSSALTHLVRNAIVHGIEAPETRTSRGKATLGHVQLDCQPCSGGVRIQVRDDGAGLDLEGLQTRARERGLAWRAGTEAELIFEDGISTAQQQDALAGRGVGMAAARSELRAVGYDLRVVTDTQVGSCFEILPLVEGDSGRHVA